MLNPTKNPPLPTGLKAAPKPAEGAAANPPEQTLSQLQNLLVGNVREELTDRVDHLGDQFADFEQYVRGEFRKFAEDLRASERRQEDTRRQSMKEVASAMELMATNVRRLAE